MGLKKWLEGLLVLFLFLFFYECDHSSILTTLMLLPYNIVNYREDDLIKTTDEVTPEDEERKQSHKGIKTEVMKDFIAETDGVEVNAFGVTFRQVSNLK